jgi:hypothetical protein
MPTPNPRESELLEPEDDAATGRQSWTKIYGTEATEEEFCSWVEHQVKEHPVVKNYHPVWKELLAWEAGDQFSIWDDSKKTVHPLEPGLRRKARIVVNMMKPLIETIESKIKFDHSVIATPNSAETKDVFGAQVATRLIAFNDKSAGLNVELGKVKYDFLRAGVGCLRWKWDVNAAGKVAPKREDGSYGDAVEEKGDVACKHVPIFNARPDPTALDPKDVRWVIEIREVTKQALLESYPKAEGFYGEISGQKEDKYNGRNVDQRNVDIEEDTVILNEFTEKPSTDYPEGRFIVTCENHVLYEGKNPSPDGETGYYWFFYRKTPYSFWCYGPLYFIKNQQKHINRLVSMASEHIEAWKPKMMVGQNALKVANSMTTDIAEIVEVDMTRGKPESMTMPELSPQVAALRDFLISSMGETANLHEVSQSRLPEYASRAPASLYQMMLEQENIKFNPTVDLINDTFLDMDRFRLKIMAKHYKMPRMVKIVGQNRASSVGYYAGVDVNGNYDVQLEHGVSIHQSSMVMLRMVMELYEKGLLGDADKPRILKLLNLATAEFDLRDDVADEERAIRENQAFIDGAWDKSPEEGGVFIYAHDDHSLHMDFHTTLHKSEEFTKMTPEAQAGLNNHEMMHFMFLTQMAQGAGGGAAVGGNSTAPSAGDQIMAGGGSNQEPSGASPGPPAGTPSAGRSQTTGGTRSEPVLQ